MDDLDRFAADLDRKADTMGDEAGVIVRAATLKTEALAKGFAPVRTGFLKSSITSEFSGTGDTTIGEVGAEAHYSGFLEFGTSKMAPRPFLNPAADIVEPKFFAACEALGDSVDGSVSRRIG